MTNYPDYTGTAKKLLEQQAEINQLKEQIRKLKDEVDQAKGLALDACNQRNFAYMERDELAEALKPFAQTATIWEHLSRQGGCFSAQDVVPLTMGPYQVARDALAKLASQG